MGRLTIRFPEDLAAWIERRAERPDTSKADVVREAVRAAKERDTGGDLEARLDAVEDRLDRLEATVDPPDGEPGGSGEAPPGESLRREIADPREFATDPPERTDEDGQ